MHAISAADIRMAARVAEWFLSRAWRLIAWDDAHGIAALALCLAADRWREGRDEAAWDGFAAKVVRNHLREAIRRARRPPPVPDRDIADASSDPARIAAARDEFRRAEAAVEPIAWRLLMLVHRDGHDHIEAARLMGLSHDAARKRVQRARDALAANRTSCAGSRPNDRNQAMPATTPTRAYDQTDRDTPTPHLIRWVLVLDYDPATGLHLCKPAERREDGSFVAIPGVGERRMEEVEGRVERPGTICEVRGPKRFAAGAVEGSTIHRG